MQVASSTDIRDARRSLSRVIVGAAMVAAMLCAWLLTPRPLLNAMPGLSNAVPTAFGQWREVKTTASVVDPVGVPGAERDMSNPYDDVLMRAYADARGNVVLLALAYARSQHQEVKIHRPELCYSSQGFRVLGRQRVVFPARSGGAAVTGQRMLVQSSNRVEAVSYWIRIGDTYSSSPWATRYYLFSQGLKGRMPDGILVRVSQIIDSPASASEARYRVQERFLADLVAATPDAARGMLVVGDSPNRRSVGAPAGAGE